MTQMIEKIIDRLILPHFPEIISYEIESFKFDADKFKSVPQMKKNVYLIRYKVTKDWTSEMEQELRTETKTLFDMLGHSNDESIDMYTLKS